MSRQGWAGYTGWWKIAIFHRALVRDSVRSSHSACRRAASGSQTARVLSITAKQASPASNEYARSGSMPRGPLRGSSKKAR